MYNGLINIYKEPGFTSFDAVAVLRGILKQKKIGHTGTLDPAAEGVLLVCLGSGTKLCDMLESKDKEYECVMLLGQSTDTEDTTGKILSEKNVICNEEEVSEAVMSFEGDIMQVPPMYSAIKKDGKRLYDLAREGKEIEREARPITIHEIEIKDISLPRVTFRVKCSKGTYIRSLCRDIGDKLGCGACMEHLVRTKVSDFEIKESLSLKRVEELTKEGKIDEYIKPVEAAFSDLESLHVKSESERIIDNGNPLCFDNITEENRDFTDGQRFRVYHPDKRFVAVYGYCEEKNIFMPVKMFFDK